jgi:hypothetical protein
MSKSEWNLGWNDDAKVAAVYYCYLSLDKADDEEKSKHFAALFDIKQNLDWYLSTLGLKAPNEKLPENDSDLETYLKNKLKAPDIAAHCGSFLKTIIFGGLLPLKSAPYFEVPYSLAFDGFSNVKEEIVRYCDDVIAKFADDERYECIVEEMDRFSVDSDSGILSADSRKFLWVFVLYSVSAGIFAGEKLKYLNHLCRITGIDKSVLAEMEEIANSFIALGKKRLEAKSSDEAYAKVVVVFETLDAEEQALHEKVNTLLNAEENTEANDDDGDSCDEKIYEPYADEDSPLLEKIGGATMNILDGIADGLSEFAAKL